jgi:hypothetical protein
MDEWTDDAGERDSGFTMLDIPSFAVPTRRLASCFSLGHRSARTRASPRTSCWEPGGAPQRNPIDAPGTSMNLSNSPDIPM